MNTANTATYTLFELPYCADAAAQVDALHGLRERIWLDSGSASQGQWQVVSAAPDQVAEQRSCEQPALFERASALLAELPAIDLPELPFTGGVIGLFGYAANHAALRVATPPANPSACSTLPVARIARYRWAALSDQHNRRTLLFFDSSCEPAFIADIRWRLENLGLTNNAAAAPFQLAAAFAATSSAEQHQAAVSRAKQYIAAGDCYQANIAQHFYAPYRGDTLAAYRALRSALPSPHSGYWQWQHNGREVALLSHSPERFIQLDQKRVETKPIKGTIARGDDAEQDAVNAQWLQESEKNRAENVMIVDLMRNDLSRCCQPGSVKVDKLFALESYANVHHLVSSVSGQLKTHCSSAQLLGECFPGGSITGAPKRRSMQIIDELEAVGRSYYCGTLACLSSNGRMDSSITIRTAVADGEQLHLWGGGGIVADSDPEAEQLESLAKIALIMQTLEAL